MSNVYIPSLRTICLLLVYFSKKLLVHVKVDAIQVLELFGTRHENLKTRGPSSGHFSNRRLVVGRNLALCTRDSIPRDDSVRTRHV